MPAEEGGVVQYELRQQVIEPKRRAFQHLVDRYGDRAASRYLEGSIDVQPREHFHYRPLWDPEHEIYDEAFSALRLADPYSFLDPRQYYYATYTQARAAHQEAFTRSLSYVVDRGLLGGLAEGWQRLLARTVVPLRHYESGAELVSAAASRFAYGTTIEQCASFAAFDRIASAQSLSRIGLALGGDTDAVLLEAKAAWLEAPALQGVRKAVEELLVEPDWAVGLLGLDLVDSMLYPMLFRELDEHALLEGASAYGLLAQHFTAWFEDQRRWLDALMRTWVHDPTHGEANRRVLQGITARWLPVARVAVGAIAREAGECLGAPQLATAGGLLADGVEARMAAALSATEQGSA